MGAGGFVVWVDCTMCLVPWSDKLPWSVGLVDLVDLVEAGWADGRGCQYQVERTCQGRGRPMEVKAR
jgi:hypothetical protein